MVKGKEIIRGLPASPGSAVGTVRVVDKDMEKMAQIKKGEAIVAERFTPEHDPFLKGAAALVTDIGGQLSHTAIIAREWKIPAVVGTIEATSVLKDGQMVVVDGNEGAVYEYLPDTGPAAAAPSLAEKMAALAAKKGIKLDPEFLEKMKKRG